ncbi:MAG: hypothetical protein K6L80_14320 [Agarilytica sp.]
MKSIGAIIFLLFLGACSQLDKHSVSVVEPDRVRFQGKGAGAGMMLMSSMGAMGIAIGVAIDEGIGKEIDESAREVGFDILGIVQASASGLKLRSPITVERYGFVTRSGENDPVAAQLHISTVAKDGEKLLVKYPEEFEDAEIQTYPLDEVKVDGSLSVKAFEYVVNLVLARVEG